MIEKLDVGRRRGKENRKIGRWEDETGGTRLIRTVEEKNSSARLSSRGEGDRAKLPTRVKSPPLTKDYRLRLKKRTCSSQDSTARRPKAGPGWGGGAGS